MNPTSKKTFERLVKKTKEIMGKERMPSIVSIHNLLTDLGIKHTFDGTQNVVEYRSEGNRYVNSRHMGKRGNRVTIKLDDVTAKAVGCYVIELDTSDSYYSHNSYAYARDLVKLIQHVTKNK